jgi:hypothetical protein
MDVRVVADIVAALAPLALGAVAVHVLIRLIARFDPALPLQNQAAARVNAIEATLSAIRRGLIKLPRVGGIRVR